VFGSRRHHIWAERVRKHVSEKVGGAPASCILSSEVITKPIGSDYLQLFDFLRFLNERIWVWGKVKVLLVVRSQAARIGSLFSQNSHRLFNANQDRFVADVFQQLHTNHSLDYGKLVIGLNDAVGPENTCVLLLEEMASLCFWERLIEFSCAHELSAEDILEDKSFSNKRTLGNHVWAIRNPNHENASKEFANSLLTFTWPEGALPSLRDSVKSLLIKSNRTYRKLYYAMETKRDTSVALSPALDQTIKDHYRSGNVALGKMIGKDLSEFGYM
jgi:hypothetical protein